MFEDEGGEDEIEEMVDTSMLILDKSMKVNLD